MTSIPAPTNPSTTTLHPWLPQSFDHLIKFSECLANSHLVPHSYRGKPDDCLVAMQFGATMGIHPMQALQNIAVINGRPSLWGDAVLALVRASPLCESISEKREGDTAICTVKRRGEPAQQRTFSKTDALRAGLWNKPGPWREYPARMLQMRARSFALRDVFPDVLFGINIAEEVRDYPESQTQIVTEAVIETKPITPAIAPPLPDYPQEKLDRHLGKWKKAIQDGRQTAQGLIDMMKDHYHLSQSQKAQILALDNPPMNTLDSSSEIVEA